MALLTRLRARERRRDAGRSKSEHQREHS
jgi:hypothetical protein